MYYVYYVYMCICVFIYIYIYREREREMLISPIYAYVCIHDTHAYIYLIDTSVCEVNTHPICGHGKTPPVLLVSMFAGMHKVSATGL